MEGRARRRGTAAAATGASPGRNKVWVEPPGKSHHPPRRSPPPPPPPPPPAAGNKVAVVYYLCRSRHLEHPHFIEVPLAAPDAGLYLRDVINRLNVLRGKGMAAMYSWSCKRSYKNGFVWHDISEDDLVLPAQGNEYILKGSELLDRSPPDRLQDGVGTAKVESLKHAQGESPQSRGSQEGCSSSSSPSAVIKEASSPRPAQQPQQLAQSVFVPSSSASTNHEDEQCRTTHSGSSGNLSPEPAGTNAPLSEESSPGPLEYRVCKPIGAQDASTQTDDSERDVRGKHARTARVCTEDGTSDAEIQECHDERSTQVSPKGPGIVRESPHMSLSEASPGDRVETLESLIRAEATRRSNYRVLEEEQFYGPMGVKLKPANLLMQLITCGSISVKDHRGFGLIPTYRPRFTQVEFPSPVFSTPMALRQLDIIPSSSRTIGVRDQESEYFSGRLVEMNQQEESGKGDMPTLKRSSSYDEDRVYRATDSRRDTESMAEPGSFRCLPQTIKMISCKQSRGGTIFSPNSDVRNSSSRQECSTRSSPLCSSRGASNRMTDPLGKLSSSRAESFHEEKDKVIKIEERS
ncbi:hypothetical protein BRADI_3g43040v3 [Brachypodium distachyon]|uniref:SOSEKI DIX-like domain-containing protein n=1 Tax=Brachypodium distachyon TaxID=15368 RepID=A0A0Q3FMI5_BRADI|nr:hypothetical protein BRADI_3g43040v3 [Brachypodium distachyon]